MQISFPDEKWEQEIWRSSEESHQILRYFQNSATICDRALCTYSLNVKRVKKRVNANSLEKEWKPLKNSCYPLEKERNEKKSEIFHSKKSEKRVRVNTSEHHSKMYCPLFNSLKNGHSLAESERHSFSSEYSTILLVLLTIHSKRSEVHSQRVNVHSLKI